MYNEKVMEIFKNPKNVGEVENYNAIGTVGNATCGDIMQITLRIEDGIIKDAKFKTFGCAAAITSSSVATSDISLPLSVQSLGDYAFYGRTVTINCEAGSKPSGWTSNCFSSGNSVNWGTV